MAPHGKLTIYSICEVQTSKARCTPHKIRYNSQTVLDITKVKTLNVIFSKRRIYVYKKNLIFHFRSNLAKIGENDQTAPEPKL